MEVCMSYHIVMAVLIVGIACHALVFMMALLNFMWLTAALAGVVTFGGVFVIDYIHNIK
jgi:hypothetical protein